MGESISTASCFPRFCSGPNRTHLTQVRVHRRSLLCDWPAEESESESFDVFLEEIPYSTFLFTKLAGELILRKTLIEKVLEIMVLQKWVGSPQLLRSGPRHNMTTFNLNQGSWRVLWVLVAVFVTGKSISWGGCVYLQDLEGNHLTRVLARRKAGMVQKYRTVACVRDVPCAVSWYWFSVEGWSMTWTKLNDIEWWWWYQNHPRFLITFGVTFWWTSSHRQMKLRFTLRAKTHLVQLWSCCWSGSNSTLCMASTISLFTPFEDSVFGVTFGDV